MEDSSNIRDDYLRNRLRHQVLPLLKAENPKLAGSVLQLSQSLRLEDDFMTQEAETRLSRARCGARLSLADFPQESEAMQLRMLIAFLAPAGTLSRRQLEAARKLCLGDCPSASLSLPGGYVLRREYGDVCLISESAPEPVPAPVTIHDEGVYSFGPWTVTCTHGPAPARLPEGTVALSAARITGPVTLRPPQAGDRISLSGGTKKLSRLYVDRKIPAPLRPYMPVVWVGNTLAAALPLRSAEPFSPVPGEECMLLHAAKKET